MKYSYWHTIPFVRFLLPFSAGVSVSLFFPIPFYPTIAAFTLSLMAYITVFLLLKKFRHATINGLLLFSTLFLFGISLNIFQNEKFHRDHFSNMQAGEYIALRVDEPPVTRVKTVKLHARAVFMIMKNGTPCRVKGNVMIYLKKDSDAAAVRYGNVLLVKFQLLKETSPPHNPDEFDYKRYLKFHHIFHQTYLTRNNYTILSLTQKNALFEWTYSVQEYFREVLSAQIGSHSETAVAQALLYGYDDDIEQEVLQAYANTGTLHVLAVSGMHVGIIFMILGWLLSFMEKSKRLRLGKSLIILTSLWIYSLLCGLSPSILRATVMFSFIIFSKMIQRHSNVYNTLAGSAFCLIAYDTNMLANVGFQLSYLAVVGIVTFHPLIYSWISPNTKLMNEIWKITAVSLAAQLTTFPIGLLYFHQFPNYFLLSNLIIIPLTTGILYAGILLLAFSKITFLASLLGKFMFWGIWLTNSIVQYMERMPYSFISGIHINIPETILIYFTLASLILFLIWRKGTWLLVSLTHACFLFAMLGFDRISQLRQHKLVIYDITSHTSANFLSGDQSVLLVDSILWASKDKVRFHMQQHFWNCGIKLQKQVFTDSTWSVIRFRGKTILVSGKGIPALPDTARYDILLVKNGYVAPEICTTAMHTFVVSSAVKAHQFTRLKKQFSIQNIPAVYVGDSGAYELSL